MKSLSALLFGASLLLATTTQADTLRIPVGEQAGSNQGALPQRGASFDSVSARWGEPSRRHAAVGQPPITRWDYPGFSVYFEYDKVIDSVRQHKAP
ncbi:phosphodiesterase [Pseudomonas abyssi]|uniref:phosphodiesterase n=1 Tax=Pseudomonas abyssi TaxID=170540 RepID=UPI003C7EAE72